MTYFDSLHTRTDLTLKVNELPLRGEIIKRRYRKRQLVNLMEDEDGDVGDEGPNNDSGDEEDVLHTQRVSYYSSGPAAETYTTNNLNYDPPMAQ